MGITDQWAPMVAAGGVDLAIDNLTSVPVLAFVLGLVAAGLRTDLRLPPAVAGALSTYLLLAIGLKGGIALSETSLTEVTRPVIATVALGLVTTVCAFGVLRRWGRFSNADAGGIAAHYGSVSVVTFTAAVTAATTAGLAPEGYLAALVAVLEVPGIVIALALARRGSSHGAMHEAIREVLAGKSVLLLAGGLVIGATAGTSGTAGVEPLFVGLFPGLLALFLLDLGGLAGQRLAEVRKAGWFLVGFALVTPVAFGALGVVAGAMAGLGTGGVAVLGAMAASASYIAAPAAVQIGLPDANPGYGLTAALAVTFPFNLLIGIPLYTEMAKVVS